MRLKLMLFVGVLLFSASCGDEEQGRAPQAAEGTLAFKSLSPISGFLYDADDSSHVFLADMDGDAMVDLISARDGALMIRRGDGMGSFGDPIEVPIPAGILASIVVFEGNDGGMVLAIEIDAFLHLSNDAGATWSELGFASGPKPCDIDGDGRREMVAVDPSGTPILLDLDRGRGDGTESAAAGNTLVDSLAMPERPCYELALADLDGDGDLDAVVLDRVILSVRSYRNDSGVWAHVGTMPISDSGHRLIAIGPDVVLAREPTPQLSWRLSGLDLAASPLALEFAPLSAVDLDGDGVPDLIGTDPAGLALWALGREDGGFAPAESAPVQPGASAITAGDIDGNGILDLAIAGGGLTILRLERR